MPEQLPGLPAPHRDRGVAARLRRRVRAARPTSASTPRCSAPQRLDGGGWRIVTDAGDEELFDALLVGNGHHWNPAFPDFPGTFAGDTLHSHHYIDTTDPLDLRDRRVLVVGIGNSAVDIASELSRKGVAEKVFVSTRSGAWVVPKYLFGKPVDQVVATIPWLLAQAPAPARRAAAAHRLGADGELRAPAPQPQVPRGPPHRLERAAAAAGLRRRRGQAQRGRAARRPRALRATAASRRSTRSSTPPATGSRSRSSTRTSSRRRTTGCPLYKRMFKPGIDDLAFVGLAQAIPTLFPFVEAQSKFLVRWLSGEWALPDRDAMEREIAADERRFVAHYNDRPRHTMQMDARVYEYELRKKVIPAGRKRAAEGMAVPLAGRAQRVGRRRACLRLRRRPRRPSGAGPRAGTAAAAPILDAVELLLRDRSIAERLGGGRGRGGRHRSLGLLLLLREQVRGPGRAAGRRVGRDGAGHDAVLRGQRRPTDALRAAHARRPRRRRGRGTSTCSSR